MTDDTSKHDDGYIPWWMRDNWSREPDEKRSIILQSVRDGGVAYDIGPYAIEFDDIEDKKTFWVNGLDALVEYLEQQNTGVHFYPIEDQSNAIENGYLVESMDED